MSNWPDHYGRCPACGEFVDYCQGHGEIGDPDGRTVLLEHEDGNHHGCNSAAKENGDCDV